MAKTYRDIPALTAQEQERFWSKVDKSPGHGPDRDCWIWTASTYDGYGQYRIRENIFRAHRIAFFLTNRQISPILAVCHSCDNEICCNPKHLWQGTYKDNLQDMAQKGRHWMKQHPELIRRGDKHGMTRIPDSEIPKIRQEYAQGVSTRKELAARYGVKLNTIDKIIERRNRKHIP